MRLKELMFPVLFIIVSAVIITMCSNKDSNISTNEIIYENSFENEDSLVSDEFKTHNFFRSKDVAFDGEWSIKVTKEHNYQVNFRLEKTSPDYYYDISIWRYGNKRSYLSVKACDETYKVFTSSFIKESKNGWDLLVYRFQLPPFYKASDMSFYYTNDSDEPAYYDKLTVTKRKKNDLNYDESKMISISFDSLAVNKIIKTRERALADQVYIVKKNDIVKAKIKFGNEKEWHTAEMRLKGDWVTHLKEYRWSFRIKLTDGHFWNGMRTFSIQKPDARGYIYEWLFHKYLTNEDILTTRYGFVPVKINGRLMGTYAWEEHFEKQIVEYRKRREGPIIKLDESTFWEVNKEYENNKKYYKLPFVQASKIIPFKKKKTLKNKVLKNIFENGQNNLYCLKFGKVNENILDYDAYSKFYALIDLFAAMHMLAWHNRRFYINPVSMKLEPIAYDGYTEDGFHKGVEEYRINSYYNKFYTSVFEDEIFKRKYYEALVHYANIDSIRKFVNNNKKQIDDFVRQINLDEPYYSFDTVEFYKHVKTVSEQINTSGYYKNIGRKNKEIKSELTTEYPDKYINMLVKANKKKNNKKTKIWFSNYSSKGLEIIGLSNVKDSIQTRIKKQINRYENEFEDNFIEFEVRFEKPKYVFYKVLGGNKTFVCKIDNWRKPDTTNVRNLLLSNSFKNPNIYKVSNGKIIFKQGKHIVKEKLIFPKGYKVIINAGTEIDFQQKACFYSESPIFINGTKDNPVLFTSSDKTAKGIFVIETNQKSIINNLKVNNFNAFSYKGWRLTGAVSFYKANVDINGIEITNNLCEDALNIISSHFDMTKARFKNIFSDAFDSDFSNGTISLSHFENIGNDAVDVSGTSVLVKDCDMESVGDKAISGGEVSVVTVNNVRIINANIGLASKDKSRVTAKNTLLQYCKYGVVAFQKKAEYGEAYLWLEKMELKKNNTDFYIEKGSAFFLDGKKIKGTKKEVAKLFYKR